LGLAKAGRLRSQKVSDPARRGQKTSLFHAADIERLRAGEDAPSVAAVEVRRSASAPIKVQTSGPADQRTWRPWLTADEAVEYSGLTRRYLLAQAEEYAQASADGMLEEYEASGGFTVLDMGRHAPGGRWRFHRGSLGR
jgi:hypothetical protein